MENITNNILLNTLFNKSKSNNNFSEHEDGLDIALNYNDGWDMWVFKQDKYKENLDKSNNLDEDIETLNMVQHSHNCYDYMLNIISQDTLKKCAKHIKENIKTNNNTDILKNSDRCRHMWMQPGYYAGLSKKNSNEEYTCSNLVDKVLKDFPGQITHIDKINDNGKIIKCKDNSNIKACQCPKGTRKGALVVAPGKTFHFYRKDFILKNGKKVSKWNGKDGSYKPSDLDANNELYKDPQDCSRKYSNVEYSDFCGYFCIPENLVPVNKI